MKLMMGNKYETDLKELHKLLKKEGIKHILRKHRAAEEGAKKIIGYNPTGDWQICIPDIDWDISIIRGMVSFGSYETYTHKDGETERFEAPEEVVSWVKEEIIK